jgi:hypothetical protein
MVFVDVFLMVSDSDDEHICFVLTTRKVTLTKQRRIPLCYCVPEMFKGSPNAALTAVSMCIN